MSDKPDHNPSPAERLFREILEELCERAGVSRQTVGIWIAKACGRGKAYAHSTVCGWARPPGLPSESIVAAYESIEKFGLRAGYLLQLLYLARMGSGLSARDARRGLADAQLEPFGGYGLEMYWRDLDASRERRNAMASLRVRERAAKELMARVRETIADDPHTPDAAPTISRERAPGSWQRSARLQRHDGVALRRGRDREEAPDDANLDRLADQLIQLVIRHGPGVGSFGDARSTRRVISRGANIVWAIEQGFEADDPRAVLAVIAMAGCGFVRGIELKRFELPAVAAAADDDQRADVLNAIALSAVGASDLAYARTCYERARDLSRSGTLSRATAELGLVEVRLRLNNDDNPRLAGPTYARFQRLEDPVGMGHCQLVRAHTTLRRGEFDTADRHVLEAAQRYRNRDRLGELNCVKVLADIAARRGQDDVALDRYELALQGYEALGYVLGCGNCWRGLAEVHLARGDDHLAAAAILVAQQRYKQVVNRLGQAHCVAMRAVLARRRGATPSRTRGQLERALWAYGEVGCESGVFLCATLLAALAAGTFTGDEPLARRGFWPFDDNG